MTAARQGRSEPAGPGLERRRFISLSSTAAMILGLLGGYGAFGSIAARFLYPAREADRRWLFVSLVRAILPGQTVLYRTPAGATVNVTRRGSGDDDFIALSSTCPHLGCQVHWEAAKSRYFCPCHNGTFDESGRGTGGPPGDAGQSLPRYPLRVENGLLFIETPVGGLLGGGAPLVAAADTPCPSRSVPCAARRRPAAGPEREQA
jgi:nitrite reductase/ring-hydroxylating ferredoxin subunit